VSLITLYYHLKPYIPARVRLGLRRLFAQRTRKIHQDIWPISESAARKPDGWTGWPEGKQFAFVIMHDVEGQVGLDKCRALLELEESLGFRSAFNFIPEGEYRVTPEFRKEIVSRGCEVGVHDLRHDGKLYNSRKTFAKNAVRINKYLRDWDAVGFRSGFMLNNLEWLHDLDIAYDASTFDTDPFEPQPEGRDTIFPFWVPRPSSLSAGGEGRGEVVFSSDLRPPTSDFGSPTSDLGSPSSVLGPLTSDPGRSQLSTLNSQPATDLRPPTSDLGPHPSSLSAGGEGRGEVAFSSVLGPRSSVLGPPTSDTDRSGYVELPYTLAQDSTLFLVLGQTSPEIWAQKLRWVAKNGGMAMIGIHPDYISFENTASNGSTYPVKRYREFLLWLRQEYNGAYWNATPRELAHHFLQTLKEKGQNSLTRLVLLGSIVGALGKEVSETIL
jgi:hypothetical protein